MIRFRLLGDCIDNMQSLIDICVTEDNVHFPIFVLLKVIKVLLDVCYDYFFEKGI